MNLQAMIHGRLRFPFALISILKNVLSKTFKTPIPVEDQDLLAGPNLAQVLVKLIRDHPNTSVKA